MDKTSKITLFLILITVLASGFYSFNKTQDTPATENLGSVGGQVLGTPTHASVTIPTTTSTITIAENTGRKSCELVNDGSFKAYCNFGQTATTTGIPIYPGGSYSIVADENLYVQQLNCIALTGTTTINTVCK
jgi:hypothetical protein